MDTPNYPTPQLPQQRLIILNEVERPYNTLKSMVVDETERNGGRGEGPYRNRSGQKPSPQLCSHR